MIAGSENDMGAARRLELSGVGISLHGRVLVPPLSLAIDGGRVAVLMGPSGSGKSSLLAHLCGTLDPVFDTVGRATLGGVDLEGLPPERRRVGILFQDDLLFPHLSVAENLAFGEVHADAHLALQPGGWIVMQRRGASHDAHHHRRRRQVHDDIAAGVQNDGVGRRNPVLGSEDPRRLQRSFGHDAGSIPSTPRDLRPARPC